MLQRTLSESGTHKFLKTLSRLILEGKGYSSIQEEYTVNINGKIYRVDVAAFKEDSKACVECGNTDSSKLDDLHKFFDEVYTLDTETALHELHNLVIKYQNLNDELTKNCDYATDQAWVLKRQLELSKAFEAEINRRNHIRELTLKRFIRLRKKEPIEPSERTDMIRVRCSTKTYEDFKNFCSKRKFPVMEEAILYMLFSTEKVEGQEKGSIHYI